MDRLTALVKLPWRAARYASHVFKDGRAAARKRQVSVFRIMHEQVALKRRRGITAPEYFEFGWDDPAMPWEDYLGESLHCRFCFVLTPPRYRFIFRNKLIFKRLFAAAGFPVAKLQGVFDPVWGRTEGGPPLRAASDLAAWMMDSGVRECVFKPVESSQGQMILVFGGRAAEGKPAFLALNEEVYTPERIATATTAYGRVAFPMTGIKLQPGSLGVDNFAQGAVSAGVDPETGTIGTGFLKSDPPGTRRTTLPGTDAVFAGFILPLWREALELARRAACFFPYARSIGWDIAITANGPYLVEGNHAWGNFQGECGRGLFAGDYRETLRQAAREVVMDRWRSADLEVLRKHRHMLK